MASLPVTPRAATPPEELQLDINKKTLSVLGESDIDWTFTTVLWEGYKIFYSLELFGRKFAFFTETVLATAKDAYVKLDLADHHVILLSPVIASSFIDIRGITVIALDTLHSRKNDTVQIEASKTLIYDKNRTGKNTLIKGSTKVLLTYKDSTIKEIWNMVHMGIKFQDPIMLLNSLSIILEKLEPVKKDTDEKKTSHEQESTESRYAKLFNFFPAS